MVSPTTSGSLDPALLARLNAMGERMSELDTRTRHAEASAALAAERALGAEAREEALRDKMAATATFSSLRAIEERASTLAKEKDIAAIERYNRGLAPLAFFTGAKVVSKTALTVAAVLGKTAVKEAAVKTSAKVLSRLCPPISILFGIAMAVTRFYRGDAWPLICLEVASGVAGCFPGIGTGIAIGIDVALGVTDVVLAVKNAPKPTDPKSIAVGSLDDAYQLHGILTHKEDGTRLSEPSREEVERAYIKVLTQLHPDRVTFTAGTIAESEFQVLRDLLFTAHSKIKTEKGWR